jgi:hypothetical protein
MHAANPYQSPLCRDDAPVRIRLYGLFPTTRATYLKLQGLGFTLLGGLLVAWFVARGTPFAASNAFFPYAPYVIAITAVLDAIEVVVVLRKFKGRERDVAALD